MGDPASGTPPREKPPEDQLDSWKEIAAYLGRDVTTVQRWEKSEAMPVHRHVHDKRSSVYALASELDAWRQSRKPRLDENKQLAVEDEAVLRAATLPEPDIRVAQSAKRFRRRLGSQAGALARGVVILAMRLLVAYVMQRGHIDGGRAAQDPVAGRTADEKHDGRSGPGIFGRRDDRSADRPAFEHSRPAGDFAHVGDAFQESADFRAGNCQSAAGRRDRGRLGDARRQSHSRHGADDSWLDRRAFLVGNLRPRSARCVHAAKRAGASHCRKVEATATGDEHARLAAARPVAPEVYESYSRGEFALNKSNSKAELEESIPYFEDAIKKDPTFAPAYVGLANAYSNLATVFIGGLPEENAAESCERGREGAGAGSESC